jgi:hypothetical protein
VIAGIVIQYGFASSMTVAISQKLSRDRIARRVGSARAADVALSWSIDIDITPTD